MVRKLAIALSTFDKRGAEELCDDLVRKLRRRGKPFPDATAQQVLGLLRRKRMFALVRRVADALLRAGSKSLTIRRQYAQALIDTGDLTAARTVLERLVKDASKNPFELAEAEGLMGRALKQQYVDGPGADKGARKRILGEALSWYGKAYTRAPDENLWHGINVVALVMRSLRDKMPLATQKSAKALAQRLVDAITSKPEAKRQCWDLATAAEACVAIEDWAGARDWLNAYAEPKSGADAFEIASTLRQFEEVWQLRKGKGGDLVALLKAALLDRVGGGCELGAGEIRRAQELGRELETKGALEPSGKEDKALERRFGSAIWKTVRWYAAGVQRAASVGRVKERFGRSWGTGFLVRASDFFRPSDVIKSDELLFLTNSHVLGLRSPKALRPEEAEVHFDAGQPGRFLTVLDLVWESPQGELDATFVRLKGDIAMPPLELSDPQVEPRFDATNPRSLYVIGYPLGEDLSLSMEDNRQVGWGVPLLHYRTPTEGGSSGSPVFDKTWSVMALHHAGGQRMPRLDGQPGYYEANEGIWIHAIAVATRK